MKFEFNYAPYEEDEGAEMEMVAGLRCLEKTEMTQEKAFEGFMHGYEDYGYYMYAQLWESHVIEQLLEQVEQYFTKRKEVMFYVKEYWKDTKKEPWKIFITPNETKFFKPHRNIENNEHFQNTAIPTELFLALLEEWKKYIESGSQEEKIVDIPFEYDEAVYRTTGKIQRKEQQA